MIDDDGNLQTFQEHVCRLCKPWLVAGEGVLRVMLMNPTLILFVIKVEYYD